MAPALVIFDCDGVLVDSERLGVRVEAEALAALGWPLTEAEVVERFMGRTTAAMRAAIEAHLGRPLDDAGDKRSTAATRRSSGRSSRPSTASSRRSTGSTSPPA